jgi:hypothetical protein
MDAHDRNIPPRQPSATHGSRRVVFVHTIWRSRATWLFSRFRATGRFHCLYEPLNERLATLRSADLDELDAAPAREDRIRLRHPDLPGGYWREYESHLSPSGIGVEGYDARFAFHPFDARNDPGPYLKNLVEESPLDEVFIVSSRSALRIGFLARLFPKARHFFLQRDAGDQFRSYGVNSRYFLPFQVTHAYLQPDLRCDLLDLFPGLRVSGLRQRWLGDDVVRLSRLFYARLVRWEESERRALFDFLRATALDRATKADLEIVDVDDLDAIRSAFEPFGVSFVGYRGPR